MGKSKKIVRIVCYPLLTILLVIGGLDCFLTIKDQHRISGTNCYLHFDSNTLSVNLIYKSCPVLTRYKTLLDHNVPEVYWNDKGDIIAIERNKKGVIVGYYLLSCTNDIKIASPFEPYSVAYFSTENSLRNHLAERRIVFTPMNHYYYSDQE